MIQTEPASMRPAGSALRCADGDVGPAVAGHVADARDAHPDALVVERGIVDVEGVRVAGLPQVVERDVHAERLAVEHGDAAAARAVEAGVRRAHREVVVAVAVDVGQRGQGHAGVPVLLEAVVAAAERRGGRGARRRVGVARERERVRRQRGGGAGAEDDVDGAAAGLGGRACHRSADRDVGEAVAVDVVADDRVAEHLAPAARDLEGGGRGIQRRGRRREARPPGRGRRRRCPHRRSSRRRPRACRSRSRRSRRR